MKIYKIWQEVNQGYDTYDSAIVIAENEEEARKMTPSPENYDNIENTNYYNFERKYCGSWAYRLEDVQVEYIGEAKEGMQAGSILGSFNAG